MIHLSTTDTSLWLIFWCPGQKLNCPGLDHGIIEDDHCGTEDAGEEVMVHSENVGSNQKSCDDKVQGIH